jgi:hypothetical protein
METEIKSIEVGYDGMVTVRTTDGKIWHDSKARFQVGDKVEVIPFMGSYKVTKVEVSK